MKCTGCGQKIGKDTEFCIHCGTKKQQRKRIRPLYIWLIAGTLVVAVLITLLFTVIMPLINYNTAVTLFDGGAYETAGDKFRELGSYKDSVMMLAKSLYKEGESDYEVGNFSDAIEPFSELAEMFPETEVLVDDAQYMTGVALAIEGEYEDAIDALEEVENYLDASELIEAAENEEQEPFIDEAISHDLPITEEEVEEIVEEAIEEQAGDQAPGQQPGGHALADLGELSDSQWLLDAAYRVEGYDSLDELKAANGYEGDIGFVHFLYHSDGMHGSRIDLGDDSATMDVYWKSDAGKDAIKLFEQHRPKQAMDKVPSFLPGNYADALGVVYGAEFPYHDLKWFDTSRPIFIAGSHGAQKWGGVTPDQIDDPVSDEAYWADYLDAMQFDEIISMKDLGQHAVGCYQRELVGISDGYMYVFVSEAWYDKPETVFVYIQQISGDVPAPDEQPAASPTQAPPEPTEQPTHNDASVDPQDYQWVIDAVEQDAGQTVEEMMSVSDETAIDHVAGIAIIKEGAQYGPAVSIAYSNGQDDIGGWVYHEFELGSAFEQKAMEIIPDAAFLQRVPYLNDSLSGVLLFADEHYAEYMFAEQAGYGSLDISRPIFVAESADPTAVQVDVEIPSKPDSYRSDEAYWAAYLDQIGFDEIVAFEGPTENDFRRIIRQVDGKVDGYHVVLAGSSFFDSPDKVMIMYQADAGGVVQAPAEVEPDIRSQAQWLIDAACEVESVDTQEELLALGELTGSIGEVILNFYPYDTDRGGSITVMSFDGHMQVDIARDHPVADGIIDTVFGMYPFAVYDPITSAVSGKSCVLVYTISNAGNNDKGLDRSKPNFAMSVDAKELARMISSVHVDASATDEEYFAPVMQYFAFDEVYRVSDLGEDGSGRSSKLLKGRIEGLDVFVTLAAKDGQYERMWIHVQAE